jgi:transcriptional regulator with XRE-family HTH domain
MNRSSFATAVRIIHPLLEAYWTQGTLSLLDVPTRSRLYGLATREAGTLWTECLTSYLNRLGWRHGISPQRLFAQEIAPHLSNDYPLRQMGAFSWKGAATLNGNGSLALECATVLEGLTTRADLHQLTWQWWVGALQTQHHLRERPAWCSACYEEWREQGLPLYEPLVWIIQVVTICTKHRRWLEHQCPSCQKRQAFLRATTLPGYCTHCNAWLGAPSNLGSADEVDGETLEWQGRVMRSLDELRRACATPEALSWEQFFTQLATCCEARGEQSRLAELAGLARGQFASWLHHSYSPTLESILEFCYVCNVTPLQVVRGELATIKQVIQTGKPCHPPRARRAFRPLDREHCLQQIQAILDGREEPIGVRPLARRLGCSMRLLEYHFPQEYALIAKRAQEHRRQRAAQRLERVRDEVRQAVITVYAQGVYPSQNKVADLLSDPNLMRMPEAKAAWLEARRELEVGL